jgi:hypothetical protein
MKGLTDIPFMADAVKLVWGQSASTALDKKHQDAAFLKRLIHFEARYKSVNSLLEILGGNNMLEISSGFSFRGLHNALHNPAVTYIDTDLPSVIEDKNNIINDLIANQLLDLHGELLVMPMNALDEDSVAKTISHFPAGPITILNEGLLVYFNTEEKKQICRIIRQTLTERGGYWITADIYIRKKGVRVADDGFGKFLQSHNVEENKFESFEQADDFFAEQGLKIHKKAEGIQGQLSSLKYLPPHAIEELSQQAAQIGRIRETWALMPA